MDIQRRIELFNQGYWEVPDDLDTSNFDFSWRPDPYDRPYIHQFGTQWQKTGGPRFVIPENEGIKYQTSQHCIRLPTPEDRCFRKLKPNVQFDYSWHPDSTSPPYIYVFGNQWYDSETMPTVQYRVKGATEKKYITDVRAELLQCRDRWIVPADINDTFDYSWVPHPDEPLLIWQFGTQHQKNGGPRYVPEGATVVKHSDILVATKLPNKEKRNWRPMKSNIEFDYSWHPDEDEPPMNYVFGNQHYNGELMPTVIYRVPGASDKKYVEYPVAKLLENKENFEVLVDDEVDFDYSWVPHPYDPPMSYIFGNQWYDSVTMPTVKYKNEQTQVEKFVDDVKATIRENSRKFRILEPISSFDFSWRPNPNDPAYTYIFGNEYHTSEFMPTVMYRVPGASGVKHVHDVKAKLEVDKVSFVDSIFDSVMEQRFDTRYVHFQNTQHPVDYKMFIPKYDNEQQYIHIIDNNSAIVPKGVKQHLYDKLTDYPYVIKHNCGTYQKPLDIIFFSNGESCAEENYQRLVDMKLPNRLVRVDGVNGRVASQYAAANSSETPWYFLVNAKLRVDENFDFSWQPNIMQTRKHYIFRAKNPINGLVYGHMAMVANNKKLTLQTKGNGLDFTMESPHEIVEILSGEAVFNSEWDVWRTAFRECIKLCHATDEQSKERLDIWTTVAEGKFAQNSIQGAKDAVDFYNEVNGDFDKLKLSYDWAWLHDRFAK